MAFDYWEEITWNCSPGTRIVKPVTIKVLKRGDKDEFYSTPSRRDTAHSIFDFVLRDARRPFIVVKSLILLLFFPAFFLFYNRTNVTREKERRMRSRRGLLRRRNDIDDLMGPQNYRRGDLICGPSHDELRLEEVSFVAISFPKMEFFRDIRRRRAGSPPFCVASGDLAKYSPLTCKISAYSCSPDGFNDHRLWKESMWYISGYSAILRWEEFFWEMIL